MILLISPVWVVIDALLILLMAACLACALVWAMVRPRASRKVRLGNTSVSLWVRERRMPTTARAIVAPVGPNLKLVDGIAKWIRDASGNKAQYEADAMAPAQPGTAVVVSGGRYRFRNAVLAVVTDEHNRTSGELITQAVASAIDAAAGTGADVCMIPDMSDDLLRQPDWITDEQRHNTAIPIAHAVVEGIRLSAGKVRDIRIWVWHKGAEDIYTSELDRALAAPQSEAQSAA